MASKSKIANQPDVHGESLNSPRQFFGVFKYSKRALELLWSTSRPLSFTSWSAVCASTKTFFATSPSGSKRSTKSPHPSSPAATVTKSAEPAAMASVTATTMAICAPPAAIATTWKWSSKP